MKPILKWTGGKSSELPIIKSALPKKFNRLIEPFLGGGAFYFDMEYKENIVNDFNRELLSFYQCFQSQAEDYKTFVDIVLRFQSERNAINDVQLTSLSTTSVIQKFEHVSSMLSYSRFLQREILLKDRTIARINADKRNKKEKLLTKEEKIVQFRTGAQAALYYAHREAYNHKNQSKSYDVAHIAYWFIMRELAYSGMFRYSSTGNFNVPYGGISYNAKDLRTKLAHIENVRKQDFFKNTEFNNMDFEDFFKKYDYFTKDDFIFLDPPYDSEFSQYNIEEDFSKEDQRRLRDVLLKTKAKVMMVIKETPFILDLYQKNFKITTFDKNYSVNFKNRNQRSVNHLMITNY